MQNKIQAFYPNSPVYFYAGQSRMRVNSIFNFLGETGCLTLEFLPVPAFLGDPTLLSFSYEVFLKLLQTMTAAPPALQHAFVKVPS